ncbi:hypothetical protein HAZT_HAZT010917 [Hyalella azteca]|uniref:Rad4 beta-hairpin domain-containing protein n=1 Tax=Hyalella azteca TaxID=294128 RepID=A0A6A0GYG5_HYAAZ|nr:hypothetical protein HAZT_HAZT010917 [Hyalella azteca]
MQAKRYKNHPMFALQRHLLKFEAFYPPNPDPVGYVRGEAVYPRNRVYTLHTRNTWKKAGKTVKVDEEPYKIVKTLKFDRALWQMIKDLPLEIFGLWQVEDYQPPVAKDGRVPRNEYGNVELFKETMLPVGTVHLDARYEDLNRVARKLKIDCAPAMVGFENHRGGSHPLFDGYVVCEEFKDLLLDTWREEKREEIKRLRRIYDNWKRLIQGMLIRNHVWEKYGQVSDEDGPSSSKKLKPKSREKTLKIQKIKKNNIETKQPKAEQKVHLGIDMNSDTVVMAKLSFKASLSSRGMVRTTKTAEDETLAAIEPKKEDLLIDSDEEAKETEEDKKAKLRKILAWNSS